MRFLERIWRVVGAIKLRAFWVNKHRLGLEFPACRQAGLNTFLGNAKKY
jgi:hypothetical protein